MKLILVVLLTVCSFAVFSQGKTSFLTAPASPQASFTQHLVDAEIEVHYSRPLARGRKIFGGLVPFDSLWRTGASGATTIRLGEEVLVGQQLLRPGKYSLFTIPGEREWTIIINADTSLHGTSGYDSKKDLHRFKVPAMVASKYYEAFTIELAEITAKGDGFLSLIWENTMVKIPLTNPIDQKVMAEIDARLINGKENNTELLYQAADYYYTTGRDLKQAAVWAAEAEKADKETFNYPNLLQKILADLKDYKAAIPVAKRALALAEKKNMTFAVTGLKKRIAELEKK